MNNIRENNSKEMVTTENAIKERLCILYSRSKNTINKKFISFKQQLYFSLSFNTANYCLYQSLIPSEFSRPDELQMLIKHWCNYLQDNNYLTIILPSYNSSPQKSYMPEHCTLLSYNSTKFKWAIPKDFLNFFCCVFKVLEDTYYTCNNSFFDANIFFTDLSNLINNYDDEDLLNKYEQLCLSIFHKKYLLATTNFYQTTHFTEASCKQKYKLQNSIQNLTFIVCNSHNTAYSTIVETYVTAILQAYTKNLKNELSNDTQYDCLYSSLNSLHMFKFETELMSKAFNSIKKYIQNCLPKLKVYFTAEQNENKCYTLDKETFKNLKNEVSNILLGADSIVNEYNAKLFESFQCLLDNKEFSSSINRDSVYQHRNACIESLKVYHQKLKAGFHNFIANINKHIEKHYLSEVDVFYTLGTKLNDASLGYSDFINTSSNLPDIAHIKKNGLLYKYAYWIFPLSIDQPMLESLLKDLNVRIQIEALTANPQIDYFCTYGLLTSNDFLRILIIIADLSAENAKN